jgi:polyisoprenoid-binding protein YceI
MVVAHRGGLAWFKGRDHHIAVRSFRGGLELSLDALNPATLGMSIDAGSLEETSPDFTPQQKAIIKRELDDIVLESAKYPTITFNSTFIRGSISGGPFQVEVGGRITLHGVTRHVIIPVTITVTERSFNAKGTFELKRSDFGVKATSAFRGWVRVKDKLTFTFDINAKPVYEG